MEEFLCCEGGEVLKHIAQRNLGHPIPGSVHDHVRWGFEHSGLMEGPPAHGRGIGTGLMFLPTQAILGFYEILKTCFYI